ncbi:hypothetical protein [Kineococcus arenarius]|uniref:hypothetical protein n=1 Tax=unclassified Kineococcus TaxID=2621656 RepID=UPI003D7DC451
MSLETVDVLVPDLVAGAQHLTDDSASVAGQSEVASSAASGAVGACGPGSFAGALSAYAAASAAAGSATAEALSSNGTTMGSNATRYQGEDASAAAVLTRAGDAFTAPAAAAPVFPGAALGAAR